jgi:hypothetical protein
MEKVISLKPPESAGTPFFLHGIFCRCPSTGTGDCPIKIKKKELPHGIQARLGFFPW